MADARPVLIPILGDQLSMGLSALDDVDRNEAVILMMEVAAETTYVQHHKRKIAFILSAMRHHADHLRAEGWTVDYVKLDDPANSGSFTGEVSRAVQRHHARAIRVTEGGEWRVQAMLDAWEAMFAIPVAVLPDTRFLASHAEFDTWAAGKTQLRMEFFYRDMRRKTGLLMTDGQPEGGQWNFDAENRKGPPMGQPIPLPPTFPPDSIALEVLELVEKRFGHHPGKLDAFGLAVTRDDALAAQAWFLEHALPQFGDYQDAMLTDQPVLWHSLLSPYLNAGLLDPLDVCRAVEDRYRAGAVPLNSAEGFIRQIIGWREYMRGIYWREGPDYAERNILGADRTLPEFYWTGDTPMHCLSQAIGQTLDLAYAHHIQRLMITGNFALLAGIDPAEVHRWYLAVYADAYEWVELPNTLGMSQFADGGIVASKPYCSSGAYIDRMSDYCRSCFYDVKVKTGPKACPFNALYWDFLDRNRAVLGRNQRLAMPYRTLDKMTDAARDALRTSARAFLATL